MSDIDKKNENVTISHYYVTYWVLIYYRKLDTQVLDIF